MQNKKHSVSYMLTLGFGLALILQVAMGGLALYEFNSNEENVTMMAANDIPIAMTLKGIVINFLELRRYEKDFLLNIGKPSKQKDYLKKYAKVTDQIQADISTVLKKMSQDEDISTETLLQAKNMSTLAKKYHDGFIANIERIENQREITPQEANILLGDLKETIHEFEQLVKFLEDESQAMIIATSKDTITGIVRIRLILQFALLASVVILVSVAYFVSKRITKPLSFAVESINNSAEHLTAASNELTTGSQRLAEGASEQAASVEETSASMAEISAQVKQNADNSSQADLIMKETTTIVSSAQGSMAKLAQSMEDISRASEETFKIVKTIDDISFQTNLLALNAAVEAARAGEAGAGFAVVADEVRNLAMRAAEASKNTAAMIEETVSKIKGGVQLVGQTSEEFIGVAESTAKVATLMSEIDVASTEQANGVEQVSTTMLEMSSVTQEIAANAEESAAVAEEMDSQTRSLLRATIELSSLAGTTIKTANQGKTNLHMPRNSKLGARKKEKVIPQLPSTARKLNTAVQKPKAIKDPADIIPFDDDGDFEDF